MVEKEEVNAAAAVNAVEDETNITISFPNNKP